MGGRLDWETGGEGGCIFVTVPKGFPVICMAYNFFVMPDREAEAEAKDRAEKLVCEFN